MNDQPQEEKPFVGLPPGLIAWAVLHRVIGVHDNRPPWSVEELVRDIGDANDVKDGINTLHAAGLINRADDLIFPSRAAIVFDQINE